MLYEVITADELRRVIEEIADSIAKSAVDMSSHAGRKTVKGERDTKAKVIEYAITMLDIKDLSQVVMVGDREFDIIGAKQQGIESIGVLYGFGDENELKTAGADYICNTVAAVGDLILL